jgi:hypothetical protein
LFAGGYGNDFSTRCIVSDLNVFHSTAPGGQLRIGRRSQGGASVADAMTFEDWRAAGYDLHSLTTDPKLKSLDPERFDWALLPESPALALGFQPIDLGDVGPRPPNLRD